jgi:hypothetical protein
VGSLIPAFLQVLGALVTHVGSGVSFEVNSSLNTMALLASKYPQELIPLSAHINGIYPLLCHMTICCDLMLISLDVFNVLP